MSDIIDDAMRRDAIAGMVNAAKLTINHARADIDGSGQIWTGRPLDDCEKAIADLDAATEALIRVGEYLQGDIAEQAERWLEEPQRCNLYIAAHCAGVGNTVRRYIGSPTSLAKQHIDYEVVRINDYTVRLRDKGTLDEKRWKFADWDGSVSFDWAVID